MDGDVAEAAAEQPTNQPQDMIAEPRAYAFDGWGMIPLELDPA